MERKCNAGHISHTSYGDFFSLYIKECATVCESKSYKSFSLQDMKRYKDFRSSIDQQYLEYIIRTIQDNIKTAVVAYRLDTVVITVENLFCKEITSFFIERLFDVTIEDAYGNCNLITIKWQ